MSSNRCTICRKAFGRKNSLVRHINNRRKPCHPATHHCNRCDKGFSSYQSLWEHRRNCHPLHSEEKRTPAEDTVEELTSFINTVSDRPKSMTPYTISLKRGDYRSPTERVEEETLLAPQKKFDSQSKINMEIDVPVTLEYSDDENDIDNHRENSEGDKEIEDLFKRLDVLSKLIIGGYRELIPAIRDTIDELKDLDVITEAEHQSLTTAIDRCL